LQDLVSQSTGTVQEQTQQQQDTQTREATQEQQTMQTLTDVMSQMDQTQMTAETRTAFESLTKLLTASESFDEKSEGGGTTREKGAGFSLGIG